MSRSKSRVGAYDAFTMLSEVAMAAVRAAAAHSPVGARRLLDILRTAPEVVKRKPDRYGPLAFVLLGRAPLPTEQQSLCERFAEEWRRGEFGTAELADALEVALGEVTKRPQDPGRHRVTGWRTLAGRPHAPDALIRPTERL